METPLVESVVKFSLVNTPMVTTTKDYSICISADDDSNAEYYANSSCFSHFGEFKYYDEGFKTARRTKHPEETPSVRRCSCHSSTPELIGY